jgi:toxin ParE1/3/4
LEISFTDAAASDIVQQFDWYLEHSGERIAKRWQQALVVLISRLSDFPETGSLCSFQSPAIQDTRRAPIKGFPRHLPFYRVRQDQLTVLRIVHGARDLESLF